MIVDHRGLFSVFNLPQEVIGLRCKLDILVPKAFKKSVFGHDLKSNERHRPLSSNLQIAILKKLKSQNLPYEQNPHIFKKLPEIKTFESLIEELQNLEDLTVQFEALELTRVTGMGVEFPVGGLVLGNPDPTAPCLLLVGGVHGLERIGSQVVLSFLDALIDRIQWDDQTQKWLHKMRVVFVPILNPIGIYHGVRSNGNNVDLMRNAPVNSDSKVPFLIGGQSWSKHLPWYRGTELEPELKALLQVIERYCFQSEASLSMDFHSGFGSFDQLWFPYARTLTPFPMLAEVHALKNHFDESYPAHGYKIEPQAVNYTTHGDFWDYAYNLRESSKTSPGFFLPMTLEMGSWYWILRNPWQMVSRHGFFNPLEHKRHDRVLREHFVLFDFLFKAVMNYKKWAYLSPQEKEFHRVYAMELWYGNKT